MSGFQMGRAPFDQEAPEPAPDSFEGHLKVIRYRAMKAALLADREGSTEAWANLMFIVVALEDAEDAYKQDQGVRALIEDAFRGVEL